jgi:Tfp pilus assembly protein PilP
MRDEMMNAKRLLAILLLMACGAWTQASAAQKPATSAPAKAKKTPASRPAPASKAATGRRDPFVSLAVVRAQQVGATCGTGKRCLVIDQVALKGVVKTPSGMIAMVENTAKKAYFLRENDPVFNGYVLKITGDSVIFKESTTDNQGRTVTRDVVKRVSAPAV